MTVFRVLELTVRFVVIYIHLCSRSHEKKEEVAMMTFQVPLVGWNLDIQRPTVSFVDAAHTVVPGLAGMSSNFLKPTVLKFTSARCARPHNRKWLDDAAAINRFGLCSR
jgi:hypothetical protein